MFGVGEVDSTAISAKIRKILADFSKIIFKPDEQFDSELKKELLSVVQKHISKLFPEEELGEISDEGFQPSEDLLDMLESPEFIDCSHQMLTLSTSMTLSDPPITLDFLNLTPQNPENFNTKLIGSLIPVFKYAKSKFE